MLKKLKILFVFIFMGSLLAQCAASKVTNSDTPPL
jgi:hypothetical protein